MCGIVGVISKNQTADQKIVQKMLDVIKHRGPESEGIWFNPSKQVALGHRRLAIIDLSPLGAQPMSTPDGRLTITFNGEIYNYQEIKQELQEKGYVFKSRSDTEVLLYAYKEWKENFLHKLNGMFSFAIWDEENKICFAARDRLGEKPFKYYFDKEKFIFASEVKAILEYPGIVREVDWQAVSTALSFRFVPSPATGFKNIFKLPAGHFLKWSKGIIEIKKYWDAGEVSTTYLGDFDTAKNELWSLFKDSVQKRLVSDVPVGAFLSGGIDSTSVVAAVAEVVKKPLQTFVISLGGKSEDQTYAKIVADYFNTEHHEFELKDINFESEIDRLITYYDEPFFDQSALPSLLISQYIKKKCTVVLSGDGGDELFGGYDNYLFISFLKKYQQLPIFLYKKLIPLICCFSKNTFYKSEVLAKDFYSAYADYFSTWKSSLPLSRKYITLEDLFSTESKLFSQVHPGFQMEKWFSTIDEQKKISTRAMIADIRGRLADGYMTKTDIAAMSSAVEIRPPFLDFRLVELALSLPDSWKIKGKITKYIWKETIKDKIPQEILIRKKMGFSIPLNKLMINQLKNKVENTLLSKGALIHTFCYPQTILRLWRDHQEQKADYSNHIWSLFILELWLKKYFGNSMS